MTRGLLTTSVGSFPKPEYLQKARNQWLAGKLAAAELADLEKQATREVIALQEELGIDILVHGEMERGDMTTFFAEKLPGSMRISGLVRSYGNRYYRKPIIKGPVRFEGPMTVGMWQYAQSLTKKPIKGMLTGPYTIVEWSFDEYYGDRRKAVLDMAEVINQEALVLEKAGALYVQIDEPAVSTRPADLPIAHEGLAIATRGLKAKTITHICYGDFNTVYDQLVALPVDQLDLELANRRYDFVDLMKARGFPKEIGFGVLDVHTHEVETVDEVKHGIELALAVLPPEKIYIDPDCGLKTRTWDEAAAKLRVMVDAVRQVKSERGID